MTRRTEHRRDEQPGQPARPLRANPGARRVARRQLQARTARREPGRDARARSSSTLAGALLGAACPAAHARVRARRLDRAVAARVAGRSADSVDDLGEREDADADLAGRACCSRGAASRALAALPVPRLAPALAGRARAGARRRRRSRPTRCSTTPPTSRRPPATTSWRRSTRGSPAAARRCSRTSTNTRCTCCAISTWAARTSSTRRPRSRPRRAATADRCTSNRCRPPRCVAYPLIVTRRDPAAPRPPVGYALRGRAPTTRCGDGGPLPAPRSSTGRSRARASEQCAQLGALAAGAPLAGATLVACASRAGAAASTSAPRCAPARLGRTAHDGARDEPSRHAARASSACRARGVWELWVQGQLMPHEPAPARRAPARARSPAS